jgi:hypothetical protein
MESTIRRHYIHMMVTALTGTTADHLRDDHGSPLPTPWLLDGRDARLEITKRHVKAHMSEDAKTFGEAMQEDRQRLNAAFRSDLEAPIAAIEELQARSPRRS